MESIQCPICKSNARVSRDGEEFLDFYDCPVCGRFKLSGFDNDSKFNKNHLASYLVYHAYRSIAKFEFRYNTVMDKDKCEVLRTEFTKGNHVKGMPVHMDSEMVENWYPRTFSERIDNIVLYISSKAEHFGQEIKIQEAELYGALFVDRYEYGSLYHEVTERNVTACMQEIFNILNYLKNMQLVNYRHVESPEKNYYLSLLPEGLKRIDERQKNSAYGRGVLIAMKFAEETKKLREAIRKGVADAGYIAVFIDEVQHNDFITPELLKHIKDSKFVVVDLTHKNNGAYFEEGYAMGLGKQVIQLCKKGVELHFDIAQKNTIIWESEEEISERLANRIRATIS